MYSHNIAKVETVEIQSPDCEILTVQINGQLARAINYVPLTGSAAIGDYVVLNTMAVELNLGSGSYHFVILNFRRLKHCSKGKGHIMKLRYTPLQMRVLAVEEEASPVHKVIADAMTLAGMPVLVAELHSMLAPAVLTLKKEKPAWRIAYLMTDGGALPAFFSNTVRILRERGLLCGVITAGHAFGGDLEAINVYSGLLAARHVLQADITIVCMGPGVVGTATPFGFSGIELADNLNRVYSLRGRAVVLPRISFADSRPRHYGLSHHTITALKHAVLVSVDLPLPVLKPEEQQLLQEQIKKHQINKKHRLFFYDNLSLAHLATEAQLCRTMGRTLDEDPAFFLAAVAAAKHLITIQTNINEFAEQ
ncbi:MAG: DUF3866 family protein [Firmicutes bacterium]|nr:DUF3866 family protein [Bacillota bacterium]